MKKWYGGVLITSLFLLLVLRYGFMKYPFGQMSVLSPFSSNISEHLNLEHPGLPTAFQNPDNNPHVVSADILVSGLFAQRNFSDEEGRTLQTWNHLNHLIDRSEVLPHAIEAIREAGAAWESLMVSVEEDRLIGSANGSVHGKAKEKQCPYSLRYMNASGIWDGRGYRLQTPCGLIQGSSITIIGTPNGLLGNFQIDLTGTPLPGEPDPPIIFHYNVRLSGDKITEDPVIVQNTWTLAKDWGTEERCPATPENNEKVDELEKCNPMLGKDDKSWLPSFKYSNGSQRPPLPKENAKLRQYFPFKQGYLSVATLRVGAEGIQMTVDGKHITSFAFRDSLEPWLVSEVKISGDLELISVLASGLPTTEELEHVFDLEILKSDPLPAHKPLDLFIGVISTANNFKRRMAVRRTWMQYDAVRSGAVAVRFFVGLRTVSSACAGNVLLELKCEGCGISQHKNQMVNEELWNEASTYGDTQLMPFVDYYSLITWKTVAICIYGTEIVSAKYVMKTDDDAFVRVDEVLASLNRVNATHGLLYGLINSDSRPHRNTDSKWYISLEEWPENTYPPWAHGPGYVVSGDIARAIYKWHKAGRLKMFKLEDVAMGIWIAEMKKGGGLDIRYVNEERVYNVGCNDGYVVAHYQEPREMLCLWHKLQEEKVAKCCG